MLRGLKRYAQDITAIVTMADDGGGSGVLRDELGMPPPGDIRNCLQALANAEPILEKLMAYRFDSGCLAGQSFGNLFLAALNGITGSFDEAVVKMSEVLAVTGRVLPVTDEDVRLEAQLTDGRWVRGESSISSCPRAEGTRIERIRLLPEGARAYPPCLRAIEAAELILIGPGSLYTSIIPNLLVDGIAAAIRRSSAVKLYICNIMTQPGETEGYSVSEHLQALLAHAGTGICDVCIANSLPIDPAVLENYARQGAEQTRVDRARVEALGVRLVEAPVASPRGDMVRHDVDLLAREILHVFREQFPTRIYGSGARP